MRSSGRVRLLGPLIALAACGGDNAPPPEDASPAEQRAELVEVGLDTIDSPRSWQAQLYVELNATIVARSEGVIESVMVDLGDVVQPGQALLHLESIDQEIALADATDREVAARRTRERLVQLASRGMATSADSELAVLEHERSSLDLRQARRNFDLTRSTAPFGGRVAARYVRPHSMVSPGDSLFRVSAMGPLRLSLRVPEEAAGGIGIGDSAAIESAAGERATAFVIQAAPIVDPASGTRQFVLQLSPGSGLRPGANVTALVGSEPRVAVLIPASALTEGGYVMVWDNGRSRLRPVVTGATLPDGRIEILAGLAAGDRIAVMGR